jgi:hypothetical protein
VSVVCRVSVVTVVLSLLSNFVVQQASAQEPSATTSTAQTKVAEEPKSLRASVAEVLLKLDATSLSERTRAERQLLDLGPDVLPLLPPPDLVSSPSAREAIKGVRHQLERRAARESAQASQVTLQGTFSLAEILREITRQTRNRVELSDAARESLKAHPDRDSLRVEYDRKPFWECVDDVCERCGWHVEFDPQRTALRLDPVQPDGPLEMAVQRSGPFRLAIHSAVLRPVVGESRRRLLRVSGRLFVEPRVRPLFLHFAANELKGAVAGTKGLTAWNPSAKYELPVSDAGRTIPLQFDFVLPDESVPPARANPRLLELHGLITVQLAAATERIVFDKTAQAPGTARRRGGVTVRLREVKFEPLADQANKLQSEIGVAVGYDAGGPAFESHRTWMFHNSVYLESERGQQFDFTEYNTSAHGDGGAVVTYRWNQLDGPATRYLFVYEAPTLILDVPLDVKLNQLEIRSELP